MLSHRVSALLALAASTAWLPQAVESRLILPINLELQAFKLRREAAATVDLPTRIQSYFTGSGFPQADRTLQEKIDEADAFLAKELPKTGAVGVSTAIVYKDQVVYAKGYGLRRYNESKASVTTDDLFQIGSVSKTFIALGVGVLVDDGKLQWNDPVKKHMPWLKLFDKYAEEHVRIGDLLSMNSGLGRSQDPALFSGAYSSAKHLIEGLEFAEPDHPLRDTTAYANVNYEVLGQLIEDVSGKPWPVFLKERIWTPLGMNHTFASVEDVPVDLQATNLNAGHIVCEHNVVGPLAMLNNPATNIAPGYKYLAAGSIVSSANDMAKLLRLVLNKGTVDGVKLFKSPAVIAEMMTGKNKAMDELFVSNGAFLPLVGYEFLPDGDSLSAGYGFDVIGHVLWGHAYVDKGGDTFVHHTTTGYAPNDDLALVLMSNTEDGSIATSTDRIRSYVLGIFLDVPKDVLDFQYAKWEAAMPSRPAPPVAGAPTCGLLYWTNSPQLPVSPAQAEALVGVYEATSSVKFFPSLKITRSSDENGFRLEMGLVNATMFLVGNMNTTLVLLPTENVAVGTGPIMAAPDADHPGKLIVTALGQSYHQQQ